MTQYDLIIIGGGPAGYSGAALAARHGLRVVLFEKSSLGGVCLNEGCIPTKTLLYSAKVLDTAKNAAKYGVQTGETSFDLAKIIARKTKTVRKLVAGIKAKMNDAGVEVRMSHATIVGRKDENFEVEAEGTLYTAPKMLLCCGAEAVIPPIAGLEPGNYLTHREALDLKTAPASLTIIGGGVIGMEFAAFYNSIGCVVTVVEMAEEILPLLDRELGLTLRQEYTKRGIRFLCNTKVERIDGTTVMYCDTEGNQLSIESEKLLIATGRKPRLEGYGLEHLGAEITRQGVVVNDRLESSVEGLYACGDINGRMQLAHTAIRDAECAVRNLIGKPDSTSTRVIPSIVYTHPEVATVGKSEEELIQTGISYTVKRRPMSFSGRFIAENEIGNGVCKLLIDDQQQIVGAHLVGTPASEIILSLAIMMEQRMTIETIERIIFPHPTVGEIIKETIEQ